MSSLPVKIKHAGKTYDLEINLEEPGLTFKSQIYSVTNILPERQKILLKGGQLKDDSDLKAFNLKANQVIMVLGTPEEQIPMAPAEQAVFLEDLEQKGQLVQTKLEPSGLVNLGNTCYLNSSLQALFTVKELQKRLTGFTKKSQEPQQNLIYFLKQLFEKMQNKDADVPPLNFLTTLRLTFPQFAEQDREHGFYKQQDAEEAYSQILNLLTSNLPGLSDVFKIEFKTETKCLEIPDDEPVIGYEDATKLSCHISIKTNFLKNGLVENLKETIEKNNDTLGRNAQYEISRKIVRLPKYLNVHFVRFFWKRETLKKSKILRKVQFPFQLDLADLLDDSIRAEKSQLRDKIYEVEKQNEDEAREYRKSKKQKLETRAQLDNEKAELTKLQQSWLDNYKKVLPESFDLESGENPSSLYELKSIITHQGASADSGHYQAFVKDENDLTGERWWKFNDNKVTVVNREKIEQLAGGGESDSALILCYKAVGLE